MDLAATLPDPKGLGFSRVTEVTGKEFGGQSAAPPPLNASKTEPPHQGIPCLEVPGAAGMQWVGVGGQPAEAWKRTPEKQLPAVSIPVRVWLEGLAEGGASTGSHTTLLGSALSPVQSSGLDITLSPSVTTAA